MTIMYYNLYSIYNIYIFSISYWILSVFYRGNKGSPDGLPGSPLDSSFLLVVVNVVGQGATSITDCLLDPSTEEVTRAAPLPEPSCDNLK